MRIGSGRLKRLFVGLAIWGAVVLIGLGRSPALAQNQFGLSDFRLNQLSSEVAALRLQVSQLQAQLGGGTGGTGRVPAASAPRIAPAPQTSTNPAQFDRLATLVIELREQVRGIDARLQAIEARFPQR